MAGQERKEGSRCREGGSGPGRRLSEEGTKGSYLARRPLRGASEQPAASAGAGQGARLAPGGHSRFCSRSSGPGVFGELEGMNSEPRRSTLEERGRVSSRSPSLPSASVPQQPGRQGQRRGRLLTRRPREGHVVLQSQVVQVDGAPPWVLRR